MSLKRPKKTAKRGQRTPKSARRTPRGGPEIRRGRRPLQGGPIYLIGRRLRVRLRRLPDGDGAARRRRRGAAQAAGGLPLLGQGRRRERVPGVRQGRGLIFL